MQAILGIEEARPRLGDLVTQTSRGEEPVMLTNRGRHFAVLVSRDDFALLRRVKERDAMAGVAKQLEEIQGALEARGLTMDDLKPLIEES